MTTFRPIGDLTIIQHNVRNWNTNKITLCNIYNQIDPDVILINEHCLTEDAPLKIFNFNTFSVNKRNEDHSGSAIAINKRLTCRLHDDFYSDMLAVTIQTRQGPITIATNYVPPRLNYINMIDMDKVLRMTNPTYILGDFNAKHWTLGHNYNNNRGKNIDQLIRQDKCIHIGPNFPTFINHRGTTSPDIVLTNRQTFHNITLTPGPLTPSDHIPIIARISANPIQIPIKPRLHYHKADWDKYKDELNDVDVPTDPTPTLEDIDEYLDDWTLKIKTASNTAIPTISYRIIPGIKPNHVTLMIQTQYVQLLDAIATQGPTLDRYRTLNRLRHQLATEYRQQYSTNWNNIIKDIDIQNNPRLFWKSIKRMTGKNTKQETPYLRHDGNRLETPQQKEPIFRNHWTQIYSGLDDEDNDFDHEHTDAIVDEMRQHVDLLSPHGTGDARRLNDLTFPPITLDELTDVIKRTKQKAPGPTQITALQLKHLPLKMKQYLLYIFNMSISAGYFPDKLKHAILIFLPKANTSQHNVKNYRPISLLDTHAKLLDKILNDRLQRHFMDNDIYNSRQHGFRPFRGTHTALATLTETIANKLADGQKMDIVLRDVSKAFDKVWTVGLKYKIIRLNLDPCFTRILNDYLTDRTATIRLNNHLGQPFTLNSGVPQGACLSPTLYNLYTHDCPPPLHNTDYITYADDNTQVIAIRGTAQAIATNTQHAIEQINTFENQWKIKTNTTKFKIIPISRRITHDIFIDNTHIPYTPQGKVLGLNLSTNGISNQINIRKNIASANLNKLYRFKHLSCTNKRKLYIALVRSALTYPIIPLHTASKTALLKLQRVQNKATRFITNTTLLDSISSQTLHDLTNLPPINIYLHEAAKNFWDKLEAIEPQLYQQLQPTQQLLIKQHYRFPSSYIASNQPVPDPIYK